MSYFAESSSVRAIAKMFENIPTSMLFTNIDSKPQSIGEVVEINKNVERSDDSEDKDGDHPAAESSTEDKENVDLQIKNKMSLEEEGTTAKKEEKIPNETEVYKHLKTYPIVNSWVKIFHWVPLPRIIRPSLMGIAYSSRFNSYTTSVDTYLDSQLDALDKAMPFVKTLRMRDIRNVILDDPIMYFVTRASDSLRSASDLTQRVLIQPSRNGIHQLRDMRGEHLPFTDNQPILRSQLNPIFKQVNSRLIEDINRFFPSPTNEEEIPINYVTFDNHSNELSYTLKLVNLAALRSRPILRERFQHLTEIPADARKYVAAVYNESQEHRGDGRIVIIIATLETIRKIVTDGYEAFSANRFFQFLQSEPTAGEKISIAEETKEVKEETKKTEQVTDE